MFITSFVLIMVDLITGVIAAKKQNIPVTSAGLRRTLSKLIIYELAMILAFITQQYLTGDTIPVSSLMAGFIGLTELTSILENLNVIGDGKLLQAILDKLGSQNK